MERTLYLLIFFFAFQSAMPVPTNREKIYQAYVHNKMDVWKKTLEEYEQKKILNPGERLELLEFQYGYAAWCIGNDRDDEASYYIKKAFRNADFLEKEKYSLSNVYAYKAALYGYEIGLAPYKAPFYGPKSKSYAQKAVDSNNTNPLAYTQLANIQFYMPAAFGGDKEQAIKYYLIAKAFLETEQKTKGNWNYLSLLATLGQAYEKVGNLLEAKSVYRKALEIEPEFDWIKNELLPTINKN